MKDYVEIDINGTVHQVREADAFLTLADFLRCRACLTGTKIVCAEGDCGACTVLTRSLRNPAASFQSLNSCICFVWQLDGHQIITVEGMKRNGQLHPAQKSMIDCHGSQCGYCTPGFICSLAKLADDAKTQSFRIDRKRAQNYLTGNLCRCTGYEPILEAAVQMPTESLEELINFYPVDLRDWRLAESLSVQFQNQRAFLPICLQDAREFCRDAPQIVAGATDLGVLHNKGRWTPQVQMSLKCVSELDRIEQDEYGYRIGANVTLSQLASALHPEFSEFSRLLNIFASPQIKNTATLVGNLMNASPIADSIPFLKVADASVHLVSPDSERVVNINDFFLPGYKQLDRRPDEFVSHLELPRSGWKFKLYKASRRKDLDISAVTTAISYSLQAGRFSHFALALGGVGPAVMHSVEWNQSLIEQRPDRAKFLELFEQINRSIVPLSDVRGSFSYRRLLVRNLLLKFCEELVSCEVNA